MSTVCDERREVRSTEVGLKACGHPSARGMALLRKRCEKRVGAFSQDPGQRPSPGLCPAGLGPALCSSSCVTTVCTDLELEECRVGIFLSSLKALLFLYCG